MNIVEQILAALPEHPVHNDYDGMTVTTGHLDRLKAAHPENHSATWAGISVRAHAGVPDGYAVLTKGGEPVGVIDFETKTVWLTKPQPRNRMQVT